MDCAALLVLLVLSGPLIQVSCSDRVSAVYGQTIVVPCHGGAPPPEGLMFVKWKYEKDGGSPGDLLIKQAHSEQPTVQATDDYAQRVSIDERSSLLVSRATLRDQRTFTCMVVSDANVMEYPVTVSVTKEPSSLEVMDRPDALHQDRMTTVGTCVAAESNPAASISWKKNGAPLVADGRVVVITPSLKLDPSTGLSTSSSTLQYAASREDMDAVFTCVSTHLQSPQEVALDPLPVHYPTQKLRLLTSPEGPVVEGGNVTLRCVADGNPPPTSFFFHTKGQKVLVKDSDSFSLRNISREDSGVSRCSLVDNEELEASVSLEVQYLDLSLSPAGTLLKMLGDSLSVEVKTSSSGEATVRWTKDGRLVEEPEISRLSFSDAGLYSCQVSMSGLTRLQSFQLQVQGKPVISSLTKRLSDDTKHKILICEADGVPEPNFLWSINATNEQRSYVDFRASSTISVSPRVNLTVVCSVSNKLGEDQRSLNVSSVFKEEAEGRGPSGDSEDQARLVGGVVGGVVGGLLLAAAVVGLVYWLYIKSSRQGSWKTGEKDEGTSEESKKLEEKNHTV